MSRILFQTAGKILKPYHSRRIPPSFQSAVQYTFQSQFLSTPQHHDHHHQQQQQRSLRSSSPDPKSKSPNNISPSEPSFERHEDVHPHNNNTEFHPLLDEQQQQRRRVKTNSGIPPGSYNTIDPTAYRKQRRNAAAAAAAASLRLFDDDDDDVDETNHETEIIKTRIMVKSIYAARKIDVVAVLSKVFQSGGVVLKRDESHPVPLRHRFGKTSVMVQLPPAPMDGKRYTREEKTMTDLLREGVRWLDGEDRAAISSSSSSYLNSSEEVMAGSETIADAATAAVPHPWERDASMRYVVVFRFGSVVFFNVAPREAAKILEEIKKHSTDPFPSGFEQNEHFEVAIQPNLDDNDNTTSKTVNADYATVKQLDLNNVAIISTIMGQTVAMDSYKIMVDELLSQFATINSTVKKTGQFTDMEKETLFKVVAQNNALFIDMVSKLGVLDRSDTAWNFSQYESIYEGMKEEFEIDNRFEHIEYKLNMIQQNAKFFLEVLQNQKSTSLEWIIIILIAFECVLMCLDMSGTGGAIISSLKFVPKGS